MLGIPAKVAGCEEVILATPPNQDGSVSLEILYIAKKVGVSKILLAGNYKLAIYYTFSEISIQYSSLAQSTDIEEKKRRNSTILLS